MKIGIDARMLNPHFGIGRYIEQLIIHLQQIDTTNEYLIFLRSDNYDLLTFKHKNFKKILADIPWYTLEEQTNFLHILKEHPVDLMHFPHWNVPYLYKGPFVVTIHDLTMYHFARPEATTLGHLKFIFKDKAHRFLIKHVAAKARHIIATSQFTAQDIVNTLGVTQDKISVIYQAPFDTTTPIVSTNDVLKKFAVSKKFVLYVGAAYPHKNLETLLRAWKLFNKEKSQEYELVLVGKGSYFYERLKQDFADVSHVIFTGLVTDDELISLYTKAEAFVFPSLYEGFGLPPLEATQYGIPVLASSASCLPEILGEGALYFDPTNVQQLADGLLDILTSEHLRDEVCMYAKENIKRFSWKDLAILTSNVYQKST